MAKISFPAGLILRCAGRHESGAWFAPAGDFHLQRGSPCFNSGTNLAWMGASRALDGNSRVDRFTGLPDMGCYEFTLNGSMIIMR